MGYRRSNLLLLLMRKQIAGNTSLVGDILLIVVWYNCFSEESALILSHGSIDLY